jgi:hypothetical protein
VLRRLSANGRRAISYARTGTGMSILGYAKDSAVLAWFEPQQLTAGETKPA